MRRFLTLFRCRRAMSAPFLVALLLSLSLSGILLSVPHVVHATGGDFGIEQVDQQIGLSGNSIVVIILRVIRILLGFLGLLLVIMILYAGYTIMTAAGNEEKVNTGKTILQNAIIGTVIIMFSFAIVQFAITVLGRATGLGPSPSGGQTPSIETFAGVGSLGQVITDHYPVPDQIAVYRNTKIVITFSDDIDPASIVNNDNNTCWASDGSGSVEIGENGEACQKIDGEVIPYYGDCIQDVCDTLKTDVISVHRLSDQKGTIEGESIGADVRVSYEEGIAHTFVLYPHALLGNDAEDQWHRVLVTNDVRNKKDEGIFDLQSTDSYAWEFQTNTDVDLTPPYVIDVSPNPGETVKKNRILKITFNEPVDPMAVQGLVGPNQSFSNVLVNALPGETAPADIVPPLTQGDATYTPSFVTFTTDAGSNANGLRFSEGFLYATYGNSVIKLAPSFETTDTLIATGQAFNNTGSGNIRDVQINGSLIYTLGDNGLFVYDKNTGEQIGTYTADISAPTAMAISGQYVFVGDGQGLKAIDASDPGNLRLASLFPYTNMANMALSADGQTAYLVKGSPKMFTVVHTAEPENLTVLNEIALPSSPKEIAVFGTRVYVSVTGGMKIIDVSQPTVDLPIVQFYPKSFGTDGGEVTSLVVDEERLFVVEYFNVKLFDLANNPDEPSLLFSFANTDIPSELGAVINLLTPLADTDRTVVRNGDLLYLTQSGFGIMTIRLDSAQSDVDLGQIGESDVETGGAMVAGQWKITNGYRTIEFVSSVPCGNNVMNSCGEPVYCLPTACESYDKTCTSSYAVFVRTASLKESEGASFLSAGLFDGVVDMADNALDSAPGVDSSGSLPPGAHDEQIYESTGWRHKAPIVGDIKQVSTDELYPDNYWWFFTVENDVDTRAPYISQVNPGVDQQGVSPSSPVNIYFSQEMSLDSFDGISIKEYPSTGVGLGYYRSSDDVVEEETIGGVPQQLTKSILHLYHPARPFGAGGDDRYYFTTVPGAVKALNGFCMYPGRGPYDDVPQVGISTPACEVSYGADWEITQVSDSCRALLVDITSSTDTACITTNDSVPTAVDEVQTCINQLSTPSVSPTNFVLP